MLLVGSWVQLSNCKITLRCLIHLILHDFNEYLLIKITGSYDSNRLVMIFCDSRLN